MRELPAPDLIQRNQTDRRIFGRLVAAGFIRSLAMSLSSVMECMMTGNYIGADGLSAASIASPICSLMSLFSDILGTGLSVSASRDLTRGDKERASRTVDSIFTVTVIVASIGTLLESLLPQLHSPFAGRIRDDSGGS